MVFGMDGQTRQLVMFKRRERKSRIVRGMAGRGIGQVARVAKTDFDGIKTEKSLLIECNINGGELCFSTASGVVTKPFGSGNREIKSLE